MSTITSSDIQEIKQRFGIIGNSPELNRAIEKAAIVAPTDISVLVTGESGVGKENIPRIIHSLSYRRHKPYIAVNCGAIPEGTIESELFGHEKGAFTGASGMRKGYFEVADGGTIFLDEVGELPLMTQVRLLRVLETGEFTENRCARGCGYQPRHGQSDTRRPVPRGFILQAQHGGDIPSSAARPPGRHTPFVQKIRLGFCREIPYAPGKAVGRRR